MDDWSAPQWTMFWFLVLSLILPPVIFWVAKFQGKQMSVTWREFNRARLGDAIEKAFVAIVLVWGGFF